MTRPCSGCGLMRCEGECYDASPEPSDETCRCGRVLNDGECAVCDAWQIEIGVDPETGRARVGL